MPRPPHLLLLLLLLLVFAAPILAGPALAVPPTVPNCKGALEPSTPGSCQGVGQAGRCDALGRVLYCDSGGLFCIDCAGRAPYCGWAPNPGYYDCNVSEPGTSDPSGLAPRTCGDCGDCAPGAACSPACPGTCGTCAGADEVCLGSGTCHAPECAGKACGKDPLGLSCGVCPSGQACDDSLGQCFALPAGCGATGAPGCAGCGCEACVCAAHPSCCAVEWDVFCAGACEVACGFDCSPCPPAPSCDGKSCGAYCGLSCGGCGAGEVCVDYHCCTPECAGKECGADGCGGLCGQCAPGVQQCDEASGMCFDKVAGCESAPGPGCGGCPCEACVCEHDAFCCESQWDGACAERCIDACGGCDPCASDPSCAGKECGTWCGQDCGACPPGGLCQAFHCCFPSCAGRQCGGDGCGGSCGGCPAGAVCSADGQCVSVGCTASGAAGCSGCDCQACVCAADAYCCDVAWDAACVASCAACGSTCGAALPPDPCAQHPAVGCCEANVRRWCDDGHLRSEACQDDAPCGWNDPQQAFTCGTTGGGHPGLKHTKACGICPAACALPKCSIDCYGPCGACPLGSTCRDDGVCVPEGTGCDGVIYEGSCVGQGAVEYCKEDTAEIITLECPSGTICDWDTAEERYACLPHDPGTCTDACRIGAVGCAANGRWAYTCQLDLATNCKVRRYEACAAGAVCLDGVCPKAAICEDACEPGAAGCLDWDSWACQQDVDGCWFQAQLTCKWGCADGACRTEPGPCGTTKVDGRCDGNVARWCVDDVLVSDDCGQGARCIEEPVTDLYRCVEQSATRPCLDHGCAP